MMKIVLELLQKDLITAVALGIAFLSFVLILVLSYLYKKIREQEIIEEVVKSTPKKEQKDIKKPDDEEMSNNISTSLPRPSLEKFTSQDAEIIIAQLKELSSQISSFNNYIQELSNTVNSLKNLQGLSNGADSNLETILVKFVNTLQELDKNINYIKQTNQNYNDAISEINKKLDNLLKILSTILQQ